MKPDARSYLRPYDTKDNILSLWGNNVRNDAIGDSLKLALIDFRNILGVINKETAPRDSPYFLAFMDLLMKLDDPCMTDPEVWLWICGDQ